MQLKLTNSFFGKTAKASALRMVADATMKAIRVLLEKAIVVLLVNGMSRRELVKQ